MKLKHLDEVTKAIVQAIADKEEEIHPYIGVGYVLYQERLAEVVREAIEKF